MPSPAGWQPEVPCVECGRRVAGLGWAERCPECRWRRERRASRIASPHLPRRCGPDGGYFVFSRLPPTSAGRLWAALIVLAVYLMVRRIAAEGGRSRRCPTSGPRRESSDAVHQRVVASAPGGPRAHFARVPSWPRPASPSTTTAACWCAARCRRAGAQGQRRTQRLELGPIEPGSLVLARPRRVISRAPRTTATCRRRAPAPAPGGPQAQRRAAPHGRRHRDVRRHAARGRSARASACPTARWRSATRAARCATRPTP